MFFWVPKKTKKVRKMSPVFRVPEGFDGLAGPGGEVRRENPSGTGGRPNRVQHASTPVGYGEFKPLREIAVPHRTPEKEHRRPTDFPGKFPADASENHGKIFPKPSPEGPRDLQNRSGRPPEAPETIKIMKIVKKCKKVV